jgi:endonuclease/exonuclease/phosphatase family metal-dependent hydrolase
MTIQLLVRLALVALAVGTAGAEPLRVLCYNLRYITSGDTGERAWTARRDQAAALIRDDKADLVGIQEGLPEMMNDLTDRVDGYAVVGVGREDGIDRGEYSAILVNTRRFRIQESGTFWLSDTPDVPNSRTWGNTVTRICTWAKLYDRRSRRTLHFFNAHYDHQSAEARQKGTELILSRIAALKPAGPVIFTGDLNAHDTDPLHAAIRAAGMTDVWRSANPDVPASESGTIHGFTGRKDQARIDYIYSSAEWKPVDAAILHNAKDGHYPSDHFPVRATLEL